MQPHHFMVNRRGRKKKKETLTDFIFLGSRITATVTATMKLKDACSMGKKAMTDLDSILKSRDHFTNKSQYSQSYGFSICSYPFSKWLFFFLMYGCESWTIKKAERLLSNCGAKKDTTGLSQGLDSPLDSKEMKPVNPKGNQP